MSKGDPLPQLPQDAPKSGDIFMHYKGDKYKVVGVALHSDETWVVVYEPMYEGAAAPFFTRPLREWAEMLDWQGKQVERFTKVGH